MDEESSLTTRDHAFGIQHLCRYFSELSPHPMLAVEGTTSIVRHVNAAFLRLSGAKREELVGHPFALCVPEGAVNGCVDLLERVYRTGRSECLAEQKHGDRTTAHWSYTVWAILGSDEQPAGLMIQVTDSTEIALFRARTAEMNEALMLGAVRQHELTESLRAIGREREYFIAVLSHELRTPLNPVLLAATMLEKDARLDADTRQMMRMIHRNITLEARLIDDLLDMTRMERGKLGVVRQPVDLRVVVEGAVEVCRADLDAGELKLSVESGGGSQFVNADAGRLQQVFSNLLRNAIKFTPAGGTIRIRSHCHGETCSVEVSDNGMGMEADFIPRAFGAFEQGDKTLARKSGLGLGLAICKTIVELHEGTITAQSDGRDRGSTFILTLPTLMGLVKVPEEKEPTLPEGPNPINALRILLVEDHPDTARLMRRLLVAEGHAVQLAGDVATAVTLAGAHQFDLLLSDLGLPDGTGVDLMRTLRAAGSALPGIVLSGYGQDQDVARSIEAGFAAHLIKPLSLKQLHQAMAELIR